MTKQELTARTKRFAIRIINLVSSLPNTQVANIIGKQLLRSGTSVGANYRPACRAKSTADFIAKLSIVEEEADESIYWLEVLVESNILGASRLEKLLDEGNQLVAIVVQAIKTTKQRRNPKSEFRNPKSQR